jgi:hypothetical protein
MFAVEFMERITALSVDTKLEPMANMLTDTVCYIVNSPRNKSNNEEYIPHPVWCTKREKYIKKRYLPICDKV